jgi:hypothetical protein
MPGCWAKAAVDAAKVSIADRKKAGPDLLARIIRHPPRPLADFMLWLWFEVRNAPSSGLALSCWYVGANAAVQ